MSISGYIRSGKGRGLSLVSLVALFLAVVYGFIIYFSGLKLLELPQLQEFLHSIPAFTVKDGVVQDQNIRWRVALPHTQEADPVTGQPANPFVVVIDTTQKELQLPVADGAYLTSEYLYVVAKHGLTVNRMQLSGSADVNPDFFNHYLTVYIRSFSVIMGIALFLVSLVVFLTIVGLSALLGLAFKIRTGEGRVWRGAAVAWSAGLILKYLISWVLSGFMGSVVVLCLCVALNLSLLKRIQD